MCEREQEKESVRTKRKADKGSGVFIERFIPAFIFSKLLIILIWVVVGPVPFKKTLGCKLGLTPFIERILTTA